MEAAMEAAMDTVTMDTATPDVEILSRNLYASLDPSLSNDERATVYQVSNFCVFGPLLYYWDN